MFLEAAVFILFVVGIALVLNINKLNIRMAVNGRLDTINKLNLRKKYLISNKKYKKNFFLKIISDSKEAFESMGKDELFYIYFSISIILLFVGVFICISLSNLFLLLILPAGLFLIPFMVILIHKNTYTKKNADALENGLSMITQGFLRSENIIIALEENLPYLDKSIKKPFENFLMETKYVNFNVEESLLRLRNAFDNPFFYEWIDTLLLCEKNIKNKILLRGILTKMSEIKSISLDLSIAYYEPIKEFITMICLIIFNIPLIYILNKEWFGILMFNPIGQFSLAVSFLFIIIGILYLIKNMRPVEIWE